MKMWKKTMALVMAFGMTFAMAACGGDDDNGGVPGENVKGEAVATQEEWNAAWEATLSATNLKMDVWGTESATGEGDHDWEKTEYEGYAKVADGKFYQYNTYEESWDYGGDEPDDKGEDSGVSERYHGVVDGTSYIWVWEDEKEDFAQYEYHWNPEDANGAYVIGMLFSDFDYEDLYEVATYNSSKGAYTYSWEESGYEGDWNYTVEIKIKDGKVVAGKQIGTCDDQGEGYAMESVTAASISYGGVSITLPGEEVEDGGNAESSVGNEESSEGGEVTGEPEELTESEMNAAIQALYNAGNITVQGTHTLAGGEISEYTTHFADGKAYTEILYQGYYSYSLAGEVDGAYYIWTTEDESDWGTAMSAEEAEVPDGKDPASISYLFEPIMEYCVYSYFNYDAVNGLHTFENLNAPYLELKVVDGKIVEFYFKTPQDVWQRGTITYGTATVGELPSL